MARVVSGDGTGATSAASAASAAIVVSGVVSAASGVSAGSAVNVLSCHPRGRFYGCGAWRYETLVSAASAAEVK